METNVALEKVIIDSQIELSEAEQIKQSYLPYFTQMAELKEQMKKIDFENPQTIDETIAREVRLSLVKVRTGSEKVKDERKKIHALKANLEQSAWNLIKADCQLQEEQLMQVEKKRELAEKARVEALRVERLEILQSLTDNATIYPLGQMSEDAFNDLVNGLKLQIEAKKEAERKAEEERIAKEKAEAERIEAQRIENERLKVEAEAREKQLELEREEARKKQAAIEAQRLAEQQKADALLEAQRKEAEKKAAKLKAEAEAKIKAEREAKEKLEAELKAKQDAENKAKAEADAKIKAEKEAAEKLAKAGEVEQLKAWVNSFPTIEIPKHLEINAVANNILTKYLNFKVWASNEVQIK
jgi:colicin import membrane protein